MIQVPNFNQLHPAYNEVFNVQLQITIRAELGIVDITYTDGSKSLKGSACAFLNEKSSEQCSN